MRARGSVGARVLQAREQAPGLAILFLAAALVFGQTPAEDNEADRIARLLAVRRIHVDKLTGESAAQIRDLLIAGLLQMRLFVLTENPERADAFLRGTAEDLVYTDTHQSSEGVSARISRGAMGTGNSRTPASGIGIGDHETYRSTERRHEATVSLRLVDKDGDVLWSTTQESRGAKFRGAGADVADKVARKLAEDYQRLKKQGALPGAKPTAP